VDESACLPARRRVRPYPRGCGRTTTRRMALLQNIASNFGYARAALPHRFCAFSSPLAAPVVRRFNSLAYIATFQSLPGAIYSQGCCSRACRHSPSGGFCQTHGSDEPGHQSSRTDRGPSGTQWPRAVSITRAAAGILSRPLRSSLCRDYRDGEPRHHVEQRDQQNDGQFAASADERLGASPVGALMWLPEKTTLPDPRPS
jgi:hypothetical protein